MVTLPSKTQLFWNAFEIAKTIAIAYFVWYALQYFGASSTPVTSVVSGSMEPTFYRGDLLLVSNNQNQTFLVGEVVVYEIEGRDILIVHRIVATTTNSNGDHQFLTKGDSNELDDRHGIYNPNQLWIEEKNIKGRVRGIIPYLGYANLLLNEYTWFKYSFFIILAVLMLLEKSTTKPEVLQCQPSTGKGTDKT